MCLNNVQKCLQCYVCEDCNELEDFKELHICGELSIVGPMKPVTLPEILEESTKRPQIKPTQKPTSKPIVLGNSEEYVYEDSDDTRDEKKATNLPTTKTLTATESTVTNKPNVDAEKNNTKLPVTLASVAATENKPLETTFKNIVMGNKTTISTTLTVTTAKPKPDQLADYDDYLEYEDPVVERRSDKSLLKINEPVCYMIRYHVNNTVVTNRGCTTFINSNKYLTCQSLYNGAPMSTCRICSTNGCNKFLSDDSDEDDHGIPLNTAGVAFDHFKVILVSIGALIIRIIFVVLL